MGIPSLFRVLSPLLALASLTLASPAQGLHEEPTLGFEFRPPRGWKQIPIRTDEAFLVAKYQAPKVERALDPKTGVMFEKTPEVQVVVFLDPDLEDVPKQETTGGDTYKTLQDYLKDNYEEGFFVEAEERQDHQGRPVTVQSIKVEGGVATLETRIVAWIYELEVGDVAVYYEVIQEAYKEHRSDIDKVMRSFTPIARHGDIRLGGGKGGFISASELKDLTPAERKEKKIESQRLEYEAVVAALPDDWDHYELDGVQVVTHADKKFTKEVVEQVNAVYDWLDATFPGVGKGEYARKPIVRICKDIEEERAFRKGSGSMGMQGTHLVTHDPTRSGAWVSEYVGGRALQLWFMERDFELWVALPAWIDFGLDQILEAARVKRGKLDFGPTKAELYLRQEMPKEDELMELQELFALDSDQIDRQVEREDYKSLFQCITATRFFADSGGRKYQALLTEYLDNLRQALDEFDEKHKEAWKDRKPPENEEEEAAMRQEIESAIKSREKELLERAAELTFGEWDRGDWLNLQRAYGRSL